MKTIDDQQLSNVSGGAGLLNLEYPEGSAGRRWQENGAALGKKLGSPLIESMGRTAGGVAYWRLHQFPQKPEFK